MSDALTDKAHAACPCGCHPKSEPWYCQECDELHRQIEKLAVEARRQDEPTRACGEYMIPTAQFHILNCLCWRDKPPAMQQPDGGEDIGCLMLRKRVKRSQDDWKKGILSDVYAAWLALGDSNIDESNRLLIKWVNLYKENP